jgi:hypothetical protein
LLAMIVADQGTNVENANRDMVTADSSVSLSSAQNATSLNYTSEVTVPLAFTTHLPVAFKGYAFCSTIPTLLDPANGSYLDTLIPLFQWDRGNDPNATLLHLELARDPDFAWMVSSLWWSGAGTGVGEFRFNFNLDPATTYYWRAWLTCDDIEGPYSDVWSFTTGSGGTILSAPALIAPANGSAPPSLPVTLQWSAVDGAVEYQPHWRNVGGVFTVVSWVTETQMGLYWLEANASYEWWVSARNDYAFGEDSEIWQFTAPPESSSLSPVDLHRFVVEDDVTTVYEEPETR